MAQNAKLVLDSFQTIVKRVDNLLAGVEHGKGNIGKLLKDEELYDRLNGIAAEGQKLLTDVRNGNGTLSKLIYDDTLYQDVRAPLKRIDAHAGRPAGGPGHRGQAAQGPGALRRSPADRSAEIRALVAELNAGKGTAGKLLKDDSSTSSSTSWWPSSTSPWTRSTPARAPWGS